MKTHRDTYPEQYAHPLCGKRVVIVHNELELARGIVERVVPSRFGELAVLAGDPKRAWALADVRLADVREESA